MGCGSDFVSPRTPLLYTVLSGNQRTIKKKASIEAYGWFEIVVAGWLLLFFT
jgi:hypothetical protein